jgi:hypothetical protein
MQSAKSCPARTGVYCPYMRMRAGHDDKAMRKKRPAAGHPRLDVTLFCYYPISRLLRFEEETR